MRYIVQRILPPSVKRREIGDYIRANPPTNAPLS